LKRFRKENLAEKENLFRLASKQPSRGKEIARDIPPLAPPSSRYLEPATTIKAELNPWTKLDQDYPLPSLPANGSVASIEVPSQDADLLSVGNNRLILALIAEMASTA
jgi:hypothetical protein